MYIAEASRILPVRNEGSTPELHGHTSLTSATITWSANNPAILRVASTDWHYLKDLKPTFEHWLSTGRVPAEASLKLRARASDYWGDILYVGSHFMVKKEIKALTVWLPYYAGPGLFA